MVISFIAHNILFIITLKGLFLEPFFHLNSEKLGKNPSKIHKYGLQIALK